MTLDAASGLSDNAVPNPGRANWRPKLVVLACSTAAGMLLCEMIVRAMHLAPEVIRINPDAPKSAFRFSDNPILAYVYKENFRGRGEDPFGVPYVNAHGFRDSERSYPKRAGSKRIIVLGDSVIAPGDIPKMLEGMFQPDNIEVLNFGISGYCTRAEVELLKERGLKYSPDLVILVFVDNDYLSFNSDLGGVGEKLPPLVEKAFLHSHLFRFVSLRLNWYHLRSLMGINDIVGIAGLPPPDQAGLELIKHRPGLELLKRNLTAIGNDNVKDGLQLLKTLSEQQGFKLIIAIWPAFEGDKILDYETVEVSKAVPLPEGQPLHIERLAAANGITSFRLSPSFREDAKQAVQQGKVKGMSLQGYYTYDGMHPRDTGNQVAATALKQIILSHSSFGGRENHPGLN